VHSEPAIERHKIHEASSFRGGKNSPIFKKEQRCEREKGIGKKKVVYQKGRGSKEKRGDGEG